MSLNNEPWPNFYLPDGNRVGGKVRGWPIDGEITQVYRQISVTGSIHGGIDIGGNLRGALIYAPVPGRVATFAQELGFAFGNWITIRAENEDYYVALAHMSEILVLNGSYVREGDPVGRVGNTGVSYGDHVHLATGTDPWFGLNFNTLRDPAAYASELEGDQMTKADRDLLNLCADVLMRNGILGIPYPDVIGLFPPGTPEQPEGSEGPFYRLTGENAAAYCKARGFAFGQAVQQMLINPPVGSHEHTKQGVNATNGPVTATFEMPRLAGTGRPADPGHEPEGVTDGS